MPASWRFLRADGSSFLREVMKSLRVAIVAFSLLGRQTKTIDDANAFEPTLLGLADLSVLMGQVPTILNPLLIKPCNIVSQPVEEVDLLPSIEFSSSDCLNA